MRQGWFDIKGLRVYCSTGERTIREWLKQGLKHARVNGTGKILVRREWIDAFLEEASLETTGPSAHELYEEIKRRRWKDGKFCRPDLSDIEHLPSFEQAMNMFPQHLELMEIIRKRRAERLANGKEESIK